MVRDSVTDEIRAVRHALAAKFNNDLARIIQRCGNSWGSWGV